MLVIITIRTDQRFQLALVYKGNCVIHGCLHKVCQGALCPQETQGAHSSRGMANQPHHSMTRQHSLSGHRSLQSQASRRGSISGRMSGETMPTDGDKEAKEGRGQGQDGGSARVQSGAQASHGGQGLPMSGAPTSPFDGQNAEGQQDNLGVGFRPAPPPPQPLHRCPSLSPCPLGHCPPYASSPFPVT